MTTDVKSRPRHFKMTLVRVSRISILIAILLTPSTYGKNGKTQSTSESDYWFQRYESAEEKLKNHVVSIIKEKDALMKEKDALMKETDAAMKEKDAVILKMSNALVSLQNE